MHITQIIPTLGVGGAESFCVDLAVFFKSKGLNSRLIVLCDVRGDRGQCLLEKATRAGVIVVVLGYSSPRKIKLVFALLNQFENLNSEFVICHLPSSEAIFLFLNVFSRIRVLRKIRVIHNTRQPGLLQRVVDIISYRVFDFNVSCTSAYEPPFYASRRKLKAINNGVSLDLGFNYLQHGRLLPADDTVTVWLVANCRGGLYGGQKGLDLFIDSIRSLCSDLSAYRFVISGVENAHLDELRALARGVSDCPNAIEVRGSFSDVVTEYLAVRPSFCVVSSRYEGLPISLMEFSIIGIPVLCSDIPELRGLYAEPLLWGFTDFYNSETASQGIVAFSERCKLFGADDFSKYSAHAIARFSFEECGNRYYELARDIF